MIKQKPLQLLTRALCGGSLTWAQAEKAKPGTGGYRRLAAMAPRTFNPPKFPAMVSVDIPEPH